MIRTWLPPRQTVTRRRSCSSRFMSVACTPRCCTSAASVAVDFNYRLTGVLQPRDGVRNSHWCDFHFYGMDVNGNLVYWAVWWTTLSWRNCLDDTRIQFPPGRWTELVSCEVKPVPTRYANDIEDWLRPLSKWIIFPRRQDCGAYLRCDLVVIFSARKFGMQDRDSWQVRH